MSTTTELKRFDPEHGISKYWDDVPPIVMTECSDGEWVRFADVQAYLAKAGEWNAAIEAAAKVCASVPVIADRAWHPGTALAVQGELIQAIRALSAPAQAQSEDAKRLEIKVCCLGDQPGDVFIFEINGKITIPNLQDMEEALQADMAENNGTFHGTGEYTFRATYSEAEKDEYGRIYAQAYWDFAEIAFKPESFECAAMSTQSDK